MTLAQTLTRAALAVVPLWTDGPSRQHSFTLGGVDGEPTATALRPPAGALARFRDVIQDELPTLIAASGPLPLALATRFVQHHLVVRWLHDRESRIDWAALIGYAEALGDRTYENDAVGCNLIVDPGTTSVGPQVSDVAHQKFLDPLAASPFSYLRVDGQLRFVAYEQVAWDDVSDAEAHELYPGFLRPLALAIEPEGFAIVRTPRGDIVILDDLGLIATKRKGWWRIYDPREIHDVLFAALGGSYALAQNVFEVTLDLSFRRHGALLIFDPDRAVFAHLANTNECRLSPDGSGDACRRMLAPALRPIALGHPKAETRKRRLLAEVASADGAVLFDEDEVLAVGAMVAPHGLATTEKGARGTAALAAFHHGGRPVKVSADGDVTFFLGTSGSTPDRLVFM